MSLDPVIGYSEDGLVIFQLMGEHKGKPAQITMQWDAGMARRIGEALRGAASKAEEKENERTSPNTH